MTDWDACCVPIADPSWKGLIACHEHATFIPALATHFGKRITEIVVAHEERHVVIQLSVAQN